jgi:predicted nucleic acid-binding Zn finger protein
MYRVWLATAVLTFESRSTRLKRDKMYTIFVCIGKHGLYIFVLGKVCACRFTTPPFINDYVQHNDDEDAL